MARYTYNEEPVPKEVLQYHYSLSLITPVKGKNGKVTY